MQVTTAMVAVLTSSQRIDLNPVCNCDSLALMMAIFPPKVVAVDEAFAKPVENSAVTHHAVALDFEGSNGIPKLPANGDKLLSAFCAQGDMTACDDLGLHLLGLYDDDDKPERPNTDIPNAKVRGRGYLEKVCKSTSAKGPRACVVLGRVLAEDNDPKGRALLTERCDKSGSGDACHFLGRSYWDGKGGPADKAKAVELLLKSKDDDAMTRAGIALMKGDGVKKDAARGKQILDKLCKDEEHKPACEAAGGATTKPAAPAPAKKK